MTQLELTETKAPRKDWSLQSERLWTFLLQHPNQEFPTPYLSRICAGNDNGWSSSITRRCFEIKKKAQSLGMDFRVTTDKRENGQRQTARTLVKL